MILTHLALFSFLNGAGEPPAPASTDPEPSKLFIGIGHAIGIRLFLFSVIIFEISHKTAKLF